MKLVKEVCKKKEKKSNFANFYKICLRNVCKVDTTTYLNKFTSFLSNTSPNLSLLKLTLKKFCLDSYIYMKPCLINST